VKVGLNFKLDF